MELSKSRIFLLSCLVFIIGIGVASFLPKNLVEYRFLLFFGAIVVLVFLILFRQNKNVVIVLFVVFSFIFSLWRYAISLPTNSPDKIWYYNGQIVRLEGLISGEPDVRQNNQKLELNIQKLIKNDREYKIEGKILVTANLYPSYNYGDLVEIYGKLQAPESFNDFAYDRYLAKFDIYSVSYYPKISVIGSGRGNIFYNYILYFKDKIRDVFFNNLSEPEASLACAVILGYKKSIPSDWQNIFAKSGISHITAISGMHISILTAMIISFFLGVGFSRRYVFYLSALTLFFYITLIGLPASAMRAGLMGFLVLWALNVGRLGKLINSLVMAALILLFINPHLLRDDIGFQLSFLAILGIVYVYPRLDEYCSSIFQKTSSRLANTKIFDSIKSIFLITISAQVFTLPVLAYNFSMISLVAPLTNIFVLWCLPLLIILTLTAAVFSFLLPGLGVLFFLPAQLILEYIMVIAKYFSELPFSFLDVEYIWPGWAILYYFFIIIILNFKKFTKTNSR